MELFRREPYPFRGERSTHSGGGGSSSTYRRDVFEDAPPPRPPLPPPPTTSRIDAYAREHEQTLYRMNPLHSTDRMAGAYYGRSSDSTQYHAPSPIGSLASRSWPQPADPSAIQLKRVGDIVSTDNYSSVPGTAGVGDVSMYSQPTVVKALTDRVGMIGVEIIQRLIDGAPAGRLASLNLGTSGSGAASGSGNMVDPLEYKELMDNPIVKSLLSQQFTR